jgi:hypothetical protein
MTVRHDKFDVHVTVHRDKFDVHVTVHRDKFDVHVTVHRDKFGVHVTVPRDKFDVHVTVHRDKFIKIKPTSFNNFSDLFLETCFGQFLCPSSGVFHCTHGNDMCHTVLL